MTLDPLSFDRLANQRPWAYRVARQLVRQEEEAEEIVQRAWITAWRQPPQRASGWRAWMRTVILNLARERSRRDEARRRHERASRPELDEGHDASENLQRSEVRERLAQHVAALPEPYRATLQLRYFEELTSPQISARLGVPAGTVRWRIKVALDLLRDGLDRECEGDRSRWLSALAAAWPALRAEAPPASPTPLEGAKRAPMALTRAVSATSVWLASLAVGSAVLFLVLDGRELRARPSVPERVSDAAVQSSSDDATGARGDAPAPTRSKAADGVLLSGTTGPSTALLEPPLPVDVVDREGRAIAGARLEVFDGSSFVLRARSDREGRASVPCEAADWGAMQAGPRLALRAVADGLAVSDVLHVDRPARGDTIRIVTGGPERVLRGLVLDADGRAVPDALVAWVERPQVMRIGVALTSPSYQTTRSGPDGTFELHHLPIDARGLFCFAPGRVVGRKIVTGLDEVVVRLGRGAIVTGVVRHPDGRPAGGVELAFDPLFQAPSWCLGLDTYDLRREGFCERTTSREDGSFEFTDVHRGRRRLWAHDPLAGRWASVIQEVDDGETWRVDPVLEERAALRLRLVDTGGVPLAGWDVQVRAPSGTGLPWSRSVCSDAEGRVVLSDLLDVKVLVSVRPPGGAGSALATRRGLAPGDLEHVIAVAEDTTSEVRGQLVDEAGRPYTEGQLLLYTPRSLTATGVSRTADGRFHADAARGPASLLLVETGRFTTLATPALVAGGPLDLGSLVVPAKGQIRLRSARNDGRLQGYRLERREPARAASTFEVTSGRFSFETELALYPGHYRLLAFGEPPQEFTLGARDSREFTLGLGRR